MTAYEGNDPAGQLRAIETAITAAGSGAGVEYTEGDTDATITGKALLWEDAADTLRPVSIAKPLPVVQTGTLTAVPEKASSANTPAIVTSAGDLLAANAARKGFSVQNLGTNVLYLRLATGASSSVFHVLLKGCTAQDDGTGGFYSDNTYTGIVSAAGTSPRLVVMEV